MMLNGYHSFQSALKQIRNGL